MTPEADAREEEGGEHLPLRRLMGLAIAQLGWSPQVFWAATPAEFHAALEVLGGEDRRRSFADFKRRIEEAGA